MYRGLIIILTIVLGLSAVDLLSAQSLSTRSKTPEIVMTRELQSKLANPKVLVLSKDNTVIIRGPINSRLVAEKQKELLDLIAKNDGIIDKKPIYVFLDTPGGSVGAGNQFIDTANIYKGNVHTITSFAASMGYHIAQSLGTRYILPSGVLMSHRATLNGVGGQIPGELITMINFIGDMLFEMDKKAAARVGIPVQQYKDLIYDEFWVTGEKAVALNHADKLALVKCDESLSGTETSNVNTIFGPIEVTVSKCPVIQGVLSSKFKGDRAALERAATVLIKGEVNKFFRKVQATY